VSARQPAGERRAPARAVLLTIALLVAFSLVGGFGLALNHSRAIVTGWVGFAVVLLISYVTRPARPNSRRSRSTEGA
jgi:hypothetical protein